MRGAGMTCAIDRVDDVSAVHAGACLAIWVKSIVAQYGARVAEDARRVEIKGLGLTR
jgi:hypothetical protein